MSDGEETVSSQLVILIDKQRSINMTYMTIFPFYLFIKLNERARRQIAKKREYSSKEEDNRSSLMNRRKKEKASDRTVYVFVVNVRRVC